jgi:hypothetical protein
MLTVGECVPSLVLGLGSYSAEMVVVVDEEARSRYC